jgi:hypothetical protein
MADYGVNSKCLKRGSVQDLEWIQITQIRSCGGIHEQGKEPSVYVKRWRIACRRTRELLNYNPAPWRQMLGQCRFCIEQFQECKQKLLNVQCIFIAVYNPIT